jgi:transposase-like protein
MGYTDAFKEQMVKRMLGPPEVSASALAKQVGVPPPTLSQWLRAASERGGTPPSSVEKTPEVAAAPKRWTAEEKLRVLAAAHGLEGEGLGACWLWRLDPRHHAAWGGPRTGVRLAPAVG